MNSLYSIDISLKRVFIYNRIDSILAWRLLLERLPTKSKLVIHGIISSESRFCVSRCGQVESAQHLFLTCNTFGFLVQFWIGFSGADTQVLSDH